MKAVDKGTSRVMKAMDQGKNPLLEAEVDFVQTCCRILGINSEERVDSIRKQALAEGIENVRKTIMQSQGCWMRWAGRPSTSSESHRSLSLTTRTWDNLDAPACSLQHLEVRVKGVRDTIIGGFARGIKMSKLDLENCMEDFGITLERTGMAAKWD